MATSYRDVLVEFGHDPKEPDEETPRDDEGRLICARACLDGSACTQEVGIPGMPCPYHDPSDRSSGNTANRLILTR